MGDVHDTSLKKELETFKNFLVNSEVEIGRHGVFNFAMDNLNGKFLSEKLTLFLAVSNVHRS